MPQINICKVLADNGRITSFAEGRRGIAAGAVRLQRQNAAMPEIVRNQIIDAEIGDVVWIGRMGKSVSITKEHIV